MLFHLHFAFCRTMPSFAVLVVILLQILPTIAQNPSISTTAQNAVFGNPSVPITVIAPPASTAVTVSVSQVSSSPSTSSASPSPSSSSATSAPAASHTPSSSTTSSFSATTYQTSSSPTSLDTSSNSGLSSGAALGGILLLALIAFTFFRYGKRAAMKSNTNNTTWSKAELGTEQPKS